MWSRVSSGSSREAMATPARPLASASACRMCQPSPSSCRTIVSGARTSWRQRMSTSRGSNHAAIPFLKAARRPLTLTDAMRRWSFFNAELTRSTLVDDGSGYGFTGTARRLNHVPGVGGGYFDGFKGAADGVLVRGGSLGPLLLHDADLHLDDLEGVVQLHVPDFLGLAAFAHQAGSA